MTLIYLTSRHIDIHKRICIFIYIKIDMYIIATHFKKKLINNSTINIKGMDSLQKVSILSKGTNRDI